MYLKKEDIIHRKIYKLDSHENPKVALVTLRAELYKEYKVFYNDFIMISSEVALRYVLEKSGQEDLFEHIKDLQKLFGFKLILDNSFLEDEIFFMHPTIPCIYCLEF